MLIWVRLGLALLCVCVDFLSFDPEELLYLMYLSPSPFKTLWTRLLLSEGYGPDVIYTSSRLKCAVKSTWTIFYLYSKVGD